LVQIKLKVPVKFYQLLKWFYLESQHLKTFLFS